MTQNTARKNRPLGVAHLIFGLVFTGIATIWLIGEANDTDTSDLAAGFPVVLIGAGLIGLAASLVNQRRAKAQLAAERAEAVDLTAATPVETTSAEAMSEPVDDLNDTTILSTEKDES